MTEPGRGSGSVGGAAVPAPRELSAALAIPALLAAYLLATSLWEPLPAVTVFDGKRLLEMHLLVLISLLALAVGPLRARTLELAARIPPWVRGALAAVILLGLASSLRQPQPGYGLAETALFALLFFGALVVAASRQLGGAAFDRLTLGSLALLGLAVATQELAGVVANWSLGHEYSFDNMLVHFNHPRFYNHLQTWSIPLLAALPAVFPRRRGATLVAAALLALQWCLLLISGGRGSVLSILTALALAAWIYRDRAGQALRLQAAGLIGGVLMFWAVQAGHASLAPQGGAYLERSVQRSLLDSTGRLYMWRLAVDDWRSAPWLGVGPMRYQCAAPPQLPAHPHNFVLQLAAERGAPAALLTLAIGAFFAMRLLAARHDGAGGEPAGPGLRPMLTAAALAAALHSNLSGVFLMPASQVAAVWVIGWLAGSTARAAPAAPGAARPAGVLLLGLALATAGWLDGFAAREIRGLEPRAAALRDAGPVQPRFWQYGRICLYSGPVTGS